MKIVLVCFAGMSTSMLVNRMNKAALEKNIKAEIIAVPACDIYNNIDDADVILLGPQARYLFNEIKNNISDKNTPIDIIDPQTYGMMNGKAVLEMALKLLNK